MKLLAVVCTLLAFAAGSFAQPPATPAPTNAAACNFAVESVGLGDQLEQHKSVLEESAADSQLSGCDKTYNFKSGRTVAGVYFDLIQFGVKNGRIHKIYAWKRTYESQVSGFRKTATEKLTAAYGDYDGKAKDKPNYGSPLVVRTWSKPSFSITLRTYIEGSYKPYTDRWAEIEITATSK